MFIAARIASARALVSSSKVASFCQETPAAGHRLLFNKTGVVKYGLLFNLICYSCLDSSDTMELNCLANFN